ncbi:MAG: N-(5'-phosphoribosyl)anthranilate isomerase [Sulfitobacter geojensis]
MHCPSSPLTTQKWIIDLFSLRAAANGVVVRRKKRDIERYVGMKEFKGALRRRGFRAIENAGQIVIFCNQEPVRAIL